MKILLIDPIGTGHHQEYTMLLAEGLRALGGQTFFFGAASLLQALSSASLIYDGMPYAELHFDSNFLNNELVRLRFFEDSILALKKVNPGIGHFLYMDRFMISAVLDRIMARKKNALCATLHAVYFLPAFAPTAAHKIKGSIDFAALQFLAKRGMRTMIHSQKITSSLAEITGLQKFDYVPYPVRSFNVTEQDKDMLRRKLRHELSLGPQDILILVFGGTRYDKGADLAIKMLSLLPTHYHLLFAGRDTYFPRRELEGIASAHSLDGRVHFDNRFIPDEDVAYYFCGCDIVLIPYRKSFSGQSGPLTIAAFFGTKIVAPNLPILEETMVENALGSVFLVENINSMADAVEKAVKLPPRSSAVGFYNQHRPESFARAVFESYTKAITDLK